MASKEQVLQAMAASSGSMSRAQLEEAVGERYQNFATQMKRWLEKGFVEDVGEQHYQLTDKGREDALQEEFSVAVERGEQTAEVEHSDESLGATEYQQFLMTGKRTGVTPLALVKQTADHIWAGGDFRDLTWVALGLQEMGIRQDLRSRWFHSWRSYLKQPLPIDLPEEFTAGNTAEGKAGAKREGAGKRDYIINEDGYPVRVGPGLGDMDYGDAMDLAKIKQARGKSDGTNATSAGSMADEIAKIFGAFKTIMGEKVEGRSFVVKPGDNGYQVEEYDPTKPMLLPQPKGPAPSKGWIVNSDGEVTQLEDGKPTVIIREPSRPAAAGGTVQLIDKRTGEIENVAPGQPVIIMRESAPAPSPMTPIQVKDKDGNPMVLDISTWFKLEEHKDKQRRDEESHQTKMDVAKGFKTVVESIGKALTRMGEEKEE